MGDVFSALLSRPCRVLCWGAPLECPEHTGKLVYAAAACALGNLGDGMIITVQHGAGTVHAQAVQPPDGRHTICTFKELSDCPCPNREFSKRTVEITSVTVRSIRITSPTFYHKFFYIQGKEYQNRQNKQNKYLLSIHVHLYCTRGIPITYVSFKLHTMLLP